MNGGIRIYLVTGLGLLLLAVLFPLVVMDEGIVSIAVLTLLFAGAAVGWNVFSGYTGYISFGHAVYYGVRAYTLALVCRDWNIAGGYLPFLLFPLSGALAGLCALVLGPIALRVRRHTFVVVTIALFYILQLLAFNLKDLTNGSAGIVLPFASAWSSDFFNIPFYYAALLLLLLALTISWWVRHSKYGLGLLAIRDDEERAVGLGVQAGAFKLIAYVISAVFVGLAGALYAYFVGEVYPATVFDPVFDVTVVMIALFGGLGTLSGPLIGAVLLVPLQQVLTAQLGANSLSLVFNGVVILGIIHFLPQGVVPSVESRWASWKASRAIGDDVSRTIKKEHHARQGKGEG